MALPVYYDFFRIYVFLKITKEIFEKRFREFWLMSICAIWKPHFDLKKKTVQVIRQNAYSQIEVKGTARGKTPSAGRRSPERKTLVKDLKIFASCWLKNKSKTKTIQLIRKICYLQLSALPRNENYNKKTPIFSCFSHPKTCGQNIEKHSERQVPEMFLEI